MEINSSLFFRIKEIELLIKKRILKIYKDAGIDITPAQSKLIIFIKNNKNVLQKDLEKLSFLSKSTLSKTLSIMESNDLIERVNIEDGRKRKIVLTNKSIEISNNIEKELSNIEKSLIENIDEEKMNVFLNVLDTIKNNVI